MGKLIVLEGIDGAGKATQVGLLIQRLRKAKKRVAHLDIPRYDTLVGRIIKESLQGKRGDFLHLDPYLKSFSYALDRGLAASSVKAALKKGFVIANRYTTSNLAYGGASYTGKERAKYMRFVEDLEYKELKIPRPDIVLYIKVDPSSAQKRLRTQTFKKLDQHERDAGYQKEVARTYAQLARGRDWVTILCHEGDTPQKIHEKIWAALVRRKVVR